MANENIEEDIDDNISISSTIDENADSDNEWPVNRVLAEGEVDGEVTYLIEWQGYTLAEATWEPRSNFKDALMADWEQTKIDQRNGLAQKFKISEWREASIQHHRDKLARHQRRNRKRANLGIPETSCALSLEELVDYLDSCPKDEEDASPPPPSSSSKRPNNQKTSKASPASSTVLQQQQKKKKPESDRRALPAVPSRSASASGPAGDQANARVFPRRQSLDQVTQPTSSSEDTGKVRRSSLSNVPPNIGLGDRSSRDPQTQHKQPTSSTSKRPWIFQQASTPVVTNVFAGGRVRKPKPNLLEAASDTTKQPKLLNSRLQRQVELRRRDKEGVTAPAQRPTTLISLDQSNPLIIQRDQPPPHKESSAEAEQPKAKKKKRAVHWEDEPMDLDPEESLFVPEQLSVPLNTFADSEEKRDDSSGPPKRSSLLKRISLDDYRAQTNRQTINKVSQLGHNGSQAITLSFSGMPLDNQDLPWLSKFAVHDRLIFTHTCTAQDFVSQTRIEGALVARQLSEGAVSSITEKAILETLADRLSLGSLAIFCRNEDYCVLLFPSDCDAWRPETLRDDTILTECPLRYSIFESKPSFRLAMLAPIPPLSTPDRKGGSSRLYLRPLEQVFGPKYEHLLPSCIADNADNKHHFFLAFPSRAWSEAAMLSGWLRSLRPDCNIRTSGFPGHWSSFVKLSHGTVIIHEDTIWAIRMFPKLGNLLHGPSANFKFWVFTRALLPLSLFDSMDATAPGVGDLRLQRVFAPGIAILVTPSFLVSQPEQAYNFLKWFWQNYSKSSDSSRRGWGKLVVCAKIDEWAYDLAMEKITLRETCSKTATEDELRQMGLSGKALEARLKTWNLLRQLATELMDEKSNSLVFAPGSIDGNDEQSLVNWFGYWTIRNMDRFRKFTVLGSSSSWPSAKRLSRMLRAPNYKRPVISDPDELYEAPPNLPSQVMPTPTAPRAGRDAEAQAITSRLADISNNSPREWCPVSLFWYPVAYWHHDMPFRFVDLSSRYSTYDHWFKFFWEEFTSQSAKKKFKTNTYAGFFYTPDTWDPSVTVLNPRRRPWVALIRPVLPHMRPWRRIELFIWDIGYAEKLTEGKICYGELSQAQQALIDYLRDKTGGSTMPLEKVWVGAFGSTQTGNTSPLEVTLRWLETALSKVRNWLPAPAGGIPARGWCLIAEEAPVERDEHHSISDPDAMDIDVPMGATAALKMIFHPPRGISKLGSSKCRNRLYQSVIKADAQMEGKVFEYLFRPTMEWYREQDEEGRGFEHIKVTSWESIFELYNIDDTKKV